MTPYTRNELEAHISGYLNAISDIKDIITPNLGGYNQFFSFPRHSDKSLYDNVITYLEGETEYYNQFRVNRLDTVKAKLNLKLLESPWEALTKELPYWCCDNELIKINGNNGFVLSERLLGTLQNFFKEKEFKLYEMNSHEVDFPWFDMMSLDFLFETESEIYILHFGEST